MMKTYYDVLQLLKRYDIYIHVGKRLWDIEMAAIEVDNLYKAGLLELKEYDHIKQILTHEHELEERQAN